MHTNSGRKMAIPRMVNSSSPFVIVTRGSGLSFHCKNNDQGCEEEKNSLVQAIAPHLSRVMQRGTAKHVITDGQEVPEGNLCVSIVAQAEREDFQEFSPTNTGCPYSRCQPLKMPRSLSKGTALMSDTEVEELEAPIKLPNLTFQRKQRRKTRDRNTKGGEEPPIIQALWVQEIDWLKTADGEMISSAEIIPPPPQFTDSVLQPFKHRDLELSLYEGCSCADVCECITGFKDAPQSEDEDRSEDAKDTASSDNRGGSDSDCGLEQDSESFCTHESGSDSSCGEEDGIQVPHSFGVEAKMSNLNFDLMHVSGFISSHANWDSEAAVHEQSLLGISDCAYSPKTSQCAFVFDDMSDADTVFGVLRGRVTLMPKLPISTFFRDLIKEALNDWKTSKSLNEGLIFHYQLQPRSCQYREGEEYSIIHHIQNGSYGDVFCIQDNRTGFECAAKKIPLSHFSSEEVSTWGALNTPRVVELFGAVRDGLNIVLFMDLKPACLAQLLKEMNSIPEDLALYYLHQSLRALEHLHHRKVLHLDVKVDNVLLSADCRDTFLCDFGLSQTLDDDGRSTRAFEGAALPGTETHMAPEVAGGDQLCAKADVWSSCCMLLHMLNGCHPWIRFYSHPLCLQIVNEPPPLWEVPSNCNNFTAKVFRAGLQKDPERRASAQELRRKTTKALRAVGGLSLWSVKSACEKLFHKNKNEDTSCTLSPEVTPTKPSAGISAAAMHWVSPWRTTAVDEDSISMEDGELDQDSEVEIGSGEWEYQPKSLLYDYTTDEKEWSTWTDSEVDIYMAEEDYAQQMWLKTDRDYDADWEEEGDEEGEDEEVERDSSMSTEYLHALRGVFPLLQKGLKTNEDSWGSEPDLEYLRDDVAVGTTIKTPSPEPRDDPPSCFSCSDPSHIDGSEKDSDHSSDDLSSGVFSSSNSQTERHLERLASANQPSSSYFEGVEVWIENVQGRCLRIRERRQVKVGHVALGISDQISVKAFTLETLDRRMVSFEDQIRESCLWLRCIPAPDRCQRWRWRVRDGKLELRE